jgi:hypothetical protein
VRIKRKEQGGLAYWLAGYVGKKRGGKLGQLERIDPKSF